MDRIWLSDELHAVGIEPIDGTVFVGVIEWDSDSAEDPPVTLAATVEDVERWYRDTVVQALTPQPNRPTPPPADASHDEIVEWMNEWREATTQAWLTIYRRPLP